MAVEISNAELLRRLEKIEKQVKTISERFDEDDILTPDDEEAILQGLREHAEGKTINHAQLKKELGM